jgi:exodeoxyribonuclease VII large subunit
MNGLENIISSYLGMKKMIRYTSDRKYANVIKDLNRKYNERFFNLNNRNVAGYDVVNKVWFF